MAVNSSHSGKLVKVHFAIVVIIGSHCQQAACRNGPLLRKLQLTSNIVGVKHIRELCWGLSHMTSFWTTYICYQVHCDYYHTKLEFTHSCL